MNKIRPLLLSAALVAGVLTLAQPMAVAAPASKAAATAVVALKPVSGTYTLDPSHTNVLAQWTHFGFSQPSAELRWCLMPQTSPSPA